MDTIFEQLSIELETRNIFAPKYSIDFQIMDVGEDNELLTFEELFNVQIGQPNEIQNIYVPTFKDITRFLNQPQVRFCVRRTPN
jgi:hypothetical protein